MGKMYRFKLLAPSVDEDGEQEGEGPEGRQPPGPLPRARQVFGSLCLFPDAQPAPARPTGGKPRQRATSDRARPTRASGVSRNSVATG